MPYKRINFTDDKKETEETASKTVRAIKKTCAAFKEDFSNGTDRLADIWTSGNPDERDKKSQKLKTETISMAQRIASGTKKNLEGITLKTVVSDFAYEFGRFFQKTWALWKDIVCDIKE